MMELMKNMMKGKNSVENTNSLNMAIPQEAKEEEPAFLLVYTHPQAQTSQRDIPNHDSTIIRLFDYLPFYSCGTNDECRIASQYKYDGHADSTRSR